MFVTLYLLSIPIFILIDAVWLYTASSWLYKPRIGHLMGEVNWLAATIFYLIFLVGLVFFAIYPSVIGGSQQSALLMGGLFGFFTYATYDLTNQATLKGWSWVITIADLFWGTFLGATVSGSVFYLYGVLF